MALDQHIIDRWHQSEVLLLGGSAGSFKVIFQAARAFTPKLNKAVLIVIHRKRNYQSEIEETFATNIHLPFREVSDKDKLEKNTIYIAPANYHTLFERNGYLSLDVSDDVWYSKPSIDVTFESAVDVYRERCTAILLSGANQDGAEGLLKLRNCGALTIVQDPADAEMPQMPIAAIHLRAAEYKLSTSDILQLLRM